MQTKLPTRRPWPVRSILFLEVGITRQYNKKIPLKNATAGLIHSSSSLLCSEKYLLRCTPPETSRVQFLTQVERRLCVQHPDCGKYSTSGHLRGGDPVEGFWDTISIETPDGNSMFSSFNGPTLTLPRQAMSHIYTTNTSHENAGAASSWLVQG